MKKIAIYGKGGSGKSTVSAALSVCFARRGLKVLHVGCDPKSDSTLTLTDGKRPQTLLELLSRGRKRPAEAEFMLPARLGITCIEAGGPEPGAGCGGRGIARMFELFDEIQLLARHDFDVVLFDVLGDVVCGGFAAPLRHGFADRAFVVVSEEPLSLYAANNILRALVTYSVNGVSLGGLIVNLSENSGPMAPLHRFAKATRSGIAGILPRDQAIQEAELTHLTASDLPESSPTRAAIERLADAVLASFDQVPELPTPLSVEELFDVAGPGRKRAGANRLQQAATDGSEGDPSARPGSSEGAGRHTPDPPAGAARNAASGSRSQAAQQEQGGSVARQLPDDATVVGSAQSLSTFASLLGITSPDVRRAMVEVRRVVHTDSAFHVSLASPTFAGLDLVLRRAGEGVQSYAAIRDVALGYTSRLTARSKQLLEFVGAFLRKSTVRFDDFVRALASDTASEAQPTFHEARNRVMRTARPVARHWSIWGKAGTQGKFFFPEERSRLVRGEIRFRDRSINIHHGTQSCQASEQPNTSYSVHFVRYPWRADDIDHSESDQSLWLFTGLDDYEIIAGTNRKLKDALDWATKHGDGRPVCVDVSCVPVVSGEDWQGILRQFKKTYPGSLTASAISGTDISEQIVTAMQAVVAGHLPTPPERRKGSVVFVGFPPTSVTNELENLLAVAGITVQQRQVPGVSLGRVPEMLSASAQILWPVGEYRRLYDDGFLKLPLPAETAVPPYGLEGTRQFVRQAARLAGVDPGEALEKVEPLLREAEAATAELAARAAGIRLGLPLQSNQAELLASPERTCGVPVVAFLEALGFTTETLMRSDEPGRLDWWLQSGLSAVYSDLWHDRRLLKAGLPSFSLADLEPGAWGAVRTLERLLAACRSPFYKRFARWTAGAPRSGKGVKP